MSRIRRSNPAPAAPAAPLTVVARAAIAPVLAQPSVRAEQVTQLILGETAAVLERQGEWRLVCTHSDGYGGWVHTGYLRELNESTADGWRSRATGWSEGGVLRIDGRPMALPMRARVALENGGAVLPDGRRGLLTDSSVRELKQVVTSARAQAPERWAGEYFLGTPYQWGGVTPWGADCSGLVQTTFAARGVALPRDSAQQVAVGAVISPDAIRPGDLLFFRGESSATITHVAFAAEADTLVHCSLACGGMMIESWLPGTRAAGLRERLAAVRRVEER
jgi:gamma-D-glutamyl-L-lysine dipeptidyl-peptidase